MSGELFVNIKYPFETPDKFEIESNVKSSHIPDVIEDYFHYIIGDGKTDDTPYRERSVYHIGLVLTMSDSEGDSYKVYSDTNNRGLTTGILMDVLNRLSGDDNQVYVEKEKAKEVLNAIYRIEIDDDEE